MKIKLQEVLTREGKFKMGMKAVRNELKMKKDEAMTLTMNLHRSKQLVEELHWKVTLKCRVKLLIKPRSYQCYKRRKILLR